VGNIQQTLVSLRNEFTAQLMDARSLGELEEIRIAYLGRNGRITKLVKNITSVESSERKSIGLLLNDTKSTMLSLLKEKENKLREGENTQFDPTLPGIKKELGHTHLVTQAINEISEIFENIGFRRLRYPEVEWDWYAFGSVNFGPDHPARDEWETFIVDNKPDKEMGQMVLTPHTTSGQVREMKRLGPVFSEPIRMINISKCYRRQSDASHVPMFHQFEGLVVDRGINITHLKGTLDYFAKQFFGPDRKTRIRPYNFPFTEPSFEVDINCGICEGKGCKVCKGGWHEIGGSGMVHPQVLKNGGIDPNHYTGFAFGWGVERVFLMKEGLGINDLRTMYSTDLRYLKQF